MSNLSDFPDYEPPVAPKRRSGWLAGVALGAVAIVAAFLYASGMFGHDTTADAPLPALIIEGG